MHSLDYRNPAQLRAGGVLIAGAGNSGAEIAKELAGQHEIWMSGRGTGEVPFKIDGLAAQVTAPVVSHFLCQQLALIFRPLVDGPVQADERPEEGGRNTPRMRAP